MSDQRDPKIEPQEFYGGVKVVDIGDIRVARGLSRRPYSSCRHKQLIYDNNERRIWCQDCETNVEAFDVFLGIVENFHYAWSRINEEKERIRFAMNGAIHRIAAKNIESAWRSRSTVPVCPNCDNGLLPEDFEHTPAIMSRKTEEERRKRAQKSQG